MAEVTLPAATRIRRFSTVQITEHWVQVIAFVVLAVTGIPQRYPGAAASQWTIDLLGGIESTRIIHRVFAALLMIAVVYHFAAAGYRKFVRREPREMVPSMDDLQAIGESVGHAIGTRRHPPRQGRFTWEEKVEYWALMWGTLVMIITGFLLWNPIATTTILPGEFIPAARAAHSAEALLAVLAVIVWHFYHVHVRSLNTSIFTGFMSRSEMEEEHPLELEAIDAGEHRGLTDRGEIRRRSSLYFPAAIMGSAILLIGIYYFTTFESTAITTIDPIEDPEIFAPVETTTTIPSGTTTTTTQPSSTTTVPAAASWEAPIAGFFDPACTSCHGSGVQTAGLDLSSYGAAVAGGDSGPGIVAGDPDASVVVQVMEAGGHPAVLSPEELDVLRAWIAAGAPETAGDAAEPPTTTTTVPGTFTWEDDFASVASQRCTSCHNPDDRVGGLDLTSYWGALAGGNSGPAVVPGDVEASVMYRVLEPRDHFAVFSEELLDAFAAWIAAGAPETADDIGRPPPPAGRFTWEDDFAPVVSERCTSCHNGDDLVGGLDLTSYETALAGGNSGPAIVPGDPEASAMYRILASGDHPAVFSDELLARLRAWIGAGAPQE